ncbi:unnamed protein product [Phytophthora fragariaefolia]|uniref:Unnamed protein product n=1 Tax=Phytophthora fragariaefolia TaxID=1490495 RepID=A0A9W6YIE5_9STRA|nr:unnamed protein product [Phytophthora fragariaefolia]
MSEFRQATAHVEALEARLALVQTAISENSPNATLEEDVGFILVGTATGGKVNDMMERFRARCYMVDPVTKTPRFGPKMLAKVQDVLLRYDEVKLAMDEENPLRLQVNAKLSQLGTEETAMKQEQAAREREAKEAHLAAELAQKQAQARLQQEARARKEDQHREEQRRLEALAAEAQKKREQREKERAEEERQRQLEEGERERLNASIPHGKEGLEKAITMLRDSTVSEVRYIMCMLDLDMGVTRRSSLMCRLFGIQTLFRQSLQKLLAVVSNICSSPENAAFRHIPKDNPHFHADLGQYTGGHQCLLTLGFKELQQGNDNDPRMVFVLEEPDLSQDLDAWSNWFDELKEMQSLVESKL